MTADQLRSRIEEGRVEAAKLDEPALPRQPAQEQQEGIAYILDDPEKLRELREQLKQRDRRIGRQHRRSRGLNM